MSLFVRTIVKKRDGAELGAGEISAFVEGVTSGEIPDEQAAAFLMAICCRGMTTAETAVLTFSMMKSGETWDLSRHGFVADKHSTGGVGDKATLVLAPLLAAVGVKAGMMSGRGLGHTGGTLDKLEAIPGFKTALPKADFDRLLDTVGCALIGQTDSIAPADRRLYALRDVTGTVESIPLITASILSKKLATGASRRRLRREDRKRRVHGGPEGRRAARAGPRRDDARDRPQGLGLPDGDGPPARRGRGKRERGRGVDPDARRRRAGRPAREHAPPRRGPRPRRRSRDEREGGAPAPQRGALRRPGSGGLPRSSSRRRAGTRASATTRSGSRSPFRGATSRRPPPASSRASRRAKSASSRSSSAAGGRRKTTSSTPPRASA